MTRLLRLALVLVVLGAVAVGGAGRDPARAASATISETGWWSRTPGTTTPEGGFQIAKAPDGPQSVAALRVNVEGEVSSALLILFETSGGYLQDGAVIEACPTTAPWTAAAGGPLEEAPASDCTNKLTLARNATIGSWTVDLAPLLQGATGPVSVVLTPGTATTVTPPQPPAVPSPVPLVPVPTAPPVPVPAVPAPVDPGFSVEFSRAELQTSETSSSVDAPTPSPSSSGSGSIASSGDFDSGTSFAPTFTPTDSFAVTPSASVTPSRTNLPAATAQAAPVGAGGVGTAASVESGLQPVAASRGAAPPWGRLLLLIPLSAVVGAVGTFGRRAAAGRSRAAVA
jgi:hypothetical protein